jgi:hypothetical protein
MPVKIKNPCSYGQQHEGVTIARFLCHVLFKHIKNDADLNANKNCVTNLRMGGVLGSFAEETFDEYMSTPDDVWAEVELQDGARVPKTFKLKDMSMSLMTLSEGSLAGRVAEGLVSHACSVRGVDFDITPPDASCMNLALNEIVENCHNEAIVCMKVPKNANAIMQCIASGYSVSVVIPVTSDILEKVVEQPTSDEQVFAMVPVVLWGYSSVSKKFAAFVPLQVHTDAVAIPFSHVMCEDSCDLYLVDINNGDDEEEEENNEPLFFSE